MQDTLLRLRYRYWPDHLLGEILSKRWTETAIPVMVLLIITILLSRAIPGFLTAGGLADTGRQAGEIGFVVLGIALVVIVGGIDLSVGSMFALCDFCALFCLNVLDWPVPAVIVATLICGAALGAINGFLVGYLRLRAFITTLITLIIYRSAYDLLLFDYSNKIAAAFPDFDSWNFIGGGVVLGVPSVVLIYVVVAIFGHVFLTRLRPGWHITAIGGSRRSAYNSGIAVRRTIALCYVASGVLTSIGAVEVITQGEPGQWTLRELPASQEMRSKMAERPPEYRLADENESVVTLRQNEKFRYELGWRQESKPGKIFHRRFLRKVDVATKKDVSVLLLGERLETIEGLPQIRSVSDCSMIRHQQSVVMLDQWLHRIGQLSG